MSEDDVPADVQRLLQAAKVSPRFRAIFETLEPSTLDPRGDLELTIELPSPDPKVFATIDADLETKSDFGTVATVDGVEAEPLPERTALDLIPLWPGDGDGSGASDSAITDEFDDLDDSEGFPTTDNSEDEPEEPERDEIENAEGDDEEFEAPDVAATPKVHFQPDLRLDVSETQHVTPGLAVLAAGSLAHVISNRYSLFGNEGVFFQDTAGPGGKKEDGKERDDITTSDPSEPEEVEEGDCRISVWSELVRVDGDKRVIRIRNRDPVHPSERAKKKKRTKQETPTVVLPLHRSWMVKGQVRAKASRINKYSGKFDLEWTRDGIVVPWTKEDGKKAAQSFSANGKAYAQLGDQLTIIATSPKDLRAKAQVINAWLDENKVGVYFRPPRLPGSQTIRARSTWTIKKTKQTCAVEETIELVWVPSREIKAYSGTADDGKPGELNVRGPEASDQDGVSMVHSPMEYLWALAEPYGCCKKRNAPVRIIQFARAIYDGGTDHRWQKGKKWSVDLLAEEREKARKKKSFRACFAQSRNTELIDHSETPAQRQARKKNRKKISKKSPGPFSYRQHDAPGLSRFEYRQALHNRTPVTLYQQFIGFLVCGDKACGSRSAESHLAHRVVRTFAYTIIWTFPGNGRNPTISRRIDQPPQAVPCLKLSDLLTANGLVEAFEDPGPAQTEGLRGRQAAGMRREAKNGIRVRLPAGK